MRLAGRIVSVAVTTTVGADGEDRHEVLGTSIGTLHAETFWTDFFAALAA